MMPRLTVPKGETPRWHWKPSKVPEQILSDQDEQEIIDNLFNVPPNRQAEIIERIDLAIHTPAEMHLESKAPRTTEVKAALRQIESDAKQLAIKLSSNLAFQIDRVHAIGPAAATHHENMQAPETPLEYTNQLAAKLTELAKHAAEAQSNEFALDGRHRADRTLYSDSMKSTWRRFLRDSLGLAISEFEMSSGQRRAIYEVCARAVSRLN